MRVTTLILITFLQMAAFSAADAAQGAPSGVAIQAGTVASQGVQMAQGTGMGDKHMDVSVTVGDSTHSRSWYAQPIWIAVFVAGGLAVLALVVMALRGSGAAGATIVK